MQVSSSFSSSRPTAPQAVLHGADQHADGTAVSTGITRIAPLARAPPARPGGAGTHDAQKCKHFAGAKGFCTGLIVSWQAYEDEAKGSKGATLKSFASRDEASVYLEQKGVPMGDKTDKNLDKTDKNTSCAPFRPPAPALSLCRAASLVLLPARASSLDSPVRPDSRRRSLASARRAHRSTCRQAQEQKGALRHRARHARRSRQRSRHTPLLRQGRYGKSGGHGKGSRRDKGGGH